MLSSEERRKRFSDLRRSRSLEELKRRALKAQRKRGKIWTVEEIDLIRVASKKMYEELFDEEYEDVYDKYGIIV